MSALIAAMRIPAARAHCPLCTAGAAVAAGGAAYMGVSTAVIGVFIGAFAASTGWWFSRIVRWDIPLKKTLFVGGSFLLTIPPMMPIMEGVKPIMVSWAGSYGSLLNRTYLLNLFLLGSILGAGIVIITPWLSAQITRMRGKMIPYQGISMTFLLLIALSIALGVLV